MNPRTITVVRIIAVTALIFAGIYALGRAAGHIGLPNAELVGPMTPTSIGWCYVGLAAAALILAIAAVFLIRPRTPARRTRTGVTLIVAATLVALVPWVGRYLAIDRCLDAGGKWDYFLDHCQ